jgi:hypothetical protein
MHAVWNRSTSHLQQLHVPLGPVRAWGFPANNDSFGDFQHYSRAISRFTTSALDVVLVDGRFRVASALWAIPRLHSSSELIIHDYEREHYHILNEVLEQKWLVGPKRCVSLAESDRCRQNRASHSQIHIHIT